MFRHCLPLYVRPLAACLGGLAGDFFEADRELILGVGRATNMDGVRDEISNFFLHPANKRWLRAAGGVRISTKRLKSIARRHFSGDIGKVPPI